MFIGLWFMMAKNQGFWRCYFWSNSTIGPFDMATYPFNGILPWTRLKDVIKALTITDETPPAYKDSFWGVGKIIYVWNQNI